MDADHRFCDELELQRDIKEYERTRKNGSRKQTAPGQQGPRTAQGWTATYLPQERTTIDRAAAEALPAGLRRLR